MYPFSCVLWAKMPQKLIPNHRTINSKQLRFLVNTEKGRKLFEAVKDRMTVIPAKLEDCLQPNLQHPSVIHPKRMNFEQDYQCKGFEYVMKKYGEIGWKQKVGKTKWKAKRIVKKLIGK